MKELIDVKNRLEWCVDGRDMWGNPTAHRADFKIKITNDIEFYISYTISWVEDNIWQFTVFYYLPHGIPATIKMCHDIENGKIMAEEHLQEIFDGMKKLLDN